MAVLALLILLVNVFVRLRINRYKRQKKVLQKIVEKKTFEISKKNRILETANEMLSKQKEEIILMSQKVKEANERKLNFFTNISHEFRTPLTLILGPAKNLIQKMNDARVVGELNVIYKNAHRLLFLLNELMDFHKLDNDQMKLHVLKTDVVKFFSEVVYSFEELAVQKGIQLTYLSNTKEYITWLDLQKMEIILYNLISNAFKFTPDGGKIQLKLLVYEERNEMEIIVEDNGIGIAEDKVKNIFDRYYQVEAPNAQYQGTGIGLAHTRELIVLMEGSIEVYTKPGKGTAFAIILPLLKEDRVRANGKIIEFRGEAVNVNKELFSVLKPLTQSDDVTEAPHKSLPTVLVLMTTMISENSSALVSKRGST